MSKVIYLFYNDILVNGFMPVRLSCISFTDIHTNYGTLSFSLEAKTTMGVCAHMTAKLVQSPFLRRRCDGAGGRHESRRPVSLPLLV